MGGVRGLACVGASAFLAACGPTLVDGPNAEGTGSSASISMSVSADDGGTSNADDSASASASVSASASASVTATQTATDTATLTATDTATLTATDTNADSSAGDETTSSISMVGCQDDGTVSWLVEVYVQMPIDGCVPPADIDPSTILLIGIDDWDGEAGSFDVGADAIASYDVEPLTGTIDLEVAAPYHPSTLEYELTGPRTKLTGSLYLETCSYVDEPPCEAATTG
jgi:hypothetical protein